MPNWDVKNVYVWEMAIVREIGSFSGAVELIMALEKNNGIADGQCQTRCCCGQDELGAMRQAVQSRVLLVRWDSTRNYFRMTRTVATTHCLFVAC